jgi:pimeloyl-ACP methyl ester carboxylesterase
LTLYAGRERYFEVDGNSICYIDEGQGPPLLFLHGLGGSISNWAPNIEYFKRSNRVIALDLPGFGKSGHFDSNYSLEFFTGAVRGLLAHLGVDRASIVGNSLGGLITLHMALFHNELVETITLVDSAGGHKFPAIIRWALKHLPPGLLKRIILFTTSYLIRFRFAYRLGGIYVINRYTRALLDEAVAVAERPDLDRYLEAYVRTARTALEVTYRDRLGEINKPALLVWGQKDLGLPLKVGQRMNTAMKGSFMVAIPRAAHVPQLDQPGAFNSALERFLSGARNGG